MSIGFDLVDISRIEICGDSVLFLSLVFSTEEIRECRGNIASLAGKFSAKEAVLKAVNLQQATIPLHLIEILKDSNGRPYLTPQSRKLLQIKSSQEVFLSITHERNIAGAVCVLA